MGLGPLRLLSRPGAGDESGGGAREWGRGGAAVGGGRATYFRVSRLLQVEQEKQCTHQALLRADTTVGADAGSVTPQVSHRAPCAQGGAAGHTAARPTSPESAGDRGWGRKWAQGPGGGRGGLTIALDHVAAGVADIAKELWTEQGLKQAAGIHAPGPGPGVWPHPAPKGSSCHLPGPPGPPRPPRPEGWSESPPPRKHRWRCCPL